MPYIAKHARFQLPDLDNMPADVWEEPTPEPEPRERIPRGPICTDPDRYLCIIGEEAFGNFTACSYTAARYRGEHCGVSPDYLRKCSPAPEPIAREIIADYLRFMAHVEYITNPDENAAELLEDIADRIETGKE